MRNYIKTNILSLGQHFVFFFFSYSPVPLAVEMESVKNSDSENIGEEGVRGKKMAVGLQVHIPFRRLRYTH